MTAPNPIAPRLDRLHDQWVEFAELPDARVLRWLVRPDELRMIEAFVASECDERAGTLPDLFVSLADPFDDVDSYGAALRAAIVAQYEASREALEADGIAAPWQAPPARPDRHSLAHLIDACTALRAAHAEVAHLALVLLPAAVRDYGEWQRWLLGAATHLPPGVRLVVTDSAEQPALAALHEADPVRVHTVAADLDMPALLGELARMGGTARPDGQFRVHFTALAAALAAGDLAAAGAAGQAALAVTVAQGWHHLTSAVHFALAAGALNAGRPEEAIAAYGAAATAGRDAAAADPVLGAKLRLNAALGMGAVLVGQREFGRAAAVYEGSIPMADAAADPFLRVECPRMAAYCHEQAGDWTRAWAQGFAALDAAEGIAPAERAHSMIPVIRDGLLRIAGGSQAHVDAVTARVAGLLPGAAAHAPADAYHAAGAQRVAPAAGGVVA